MCHSLLTEPKRILNLEPNGMVLGILDWLNMECIIMGEFARVGREWVVLRMGVLMKLILVGLILRICHLESPPIRILVSSGILTRNWVSRVRYFLSLSIDRSIEWNDRLG